MIIFILNHRVEREKEKKKIEDIIPQKIQINHQKIPLLKRRNVIHIIENIKMMIERKRKREITEEKEVEVEIEVIQEREIIMREDKF